MNKVLAVAFVAAVVAGASSSADARGGCGEGWHPGPYGHHCFRNTGGEAVIVAPHEAIVVGGGGPAIGVFVTGRGYWDGHRYWWHHERWHGGWRFR